MFEKLARQPFIYEGFEHHDLINFTKSRRLKLGKTAQQPLTKYTSKCAAMVQKPDVDGAVAQHGQSDYSNDTPNTESRVLLRRSSRLAAKTRSAASTAVNKALSLNTPGRTSMPARGPAA
ncbi:unnamed protein product [Aureobasidium mustum]|uniref:Uncharacterized protein n=1 Tax=Aureobasidium mustum TaxID=2773714 RepID=A0A9N8K5W7_9PEZI|nr:unnamed protein product [Aureobasidium mustum]